MVSTSRSSGERGYVPLRGSGMVCGYDRRENVRSAGVKHRTRPAATLGASQPQTSVHWTRRVRSSLMEKRTHRSTGLGTCWALRSWRNGHSADTADKAVRALSAVSALCPFLHERRNQPLMAVAAIKYSNAIH